MAEDDDEVSLVTCGTTKGDIVLELHKKWSPHGYDNAVKLFQAGYYDHSHFFRTVKGFLVQFGITYRKDLAPMGRTTIPDDPQLDPRIPFTTGTISFAGSGPNSRSSHLFISLMPKGGGFGRELWETPVGKVKSGMEVVNSFYADYGDMPPWGKGPTQQSIHSGGEAYMLENFPLMDRFLECTVERQEIPIAPKPIIVADVPKPAATMGDTKPSTLRKHGSIPPGHANNNSNNNNGGEYVTGQLHHQHSLHFNTNNEEEGLTRLSWELLGSCLILFVGVLVLWLRFVLSPPRKSRKTS